MFENRFKQTEYGIIPQDWCFERLGDITTKIGSGKTPLGGAAIYTNSGHMFVRSQNVGWGKFILDDVAYIKEEIHESQISSELKKDDILLNITGASIGRVAIVNDVVAGGNVNQHVCIIRLKEGLYDSRYLGYYMMSSYIQNHISEQQSGGSREALNFKQISDFQILLPSLEEQKHISTVISSTDKLISNIEQLIEKKQAIKKGTMQFLLGNIKAKATLLDDYVRCGIIRLFRGKVISKSDIENTPGNYPIYSSSIHNEGLMGKYGKFMFDEEMISWSVDGGGNFFYRPKHKFSITNVSGYMRVNTDVINYKFLAYLLQFEHSKKIFDYQSKAHPSVIRKAYELRIPSLEQQVRIADTLEGMDKEIHALKVKLSKYQDLRQGIMQQLLTGKIRLK